MKKILFMMALAAATTVFADRVTLSYFSLGPDAYADGKAVLEGEYYALVFVKDGATFAGFNANGTLVDPANSTVLEMGPWAKAWASAGVGCAPHNIQPEREDAAKYVDGSIRLYVLDTRTAEGTLSGTTADGLPAIVNGYGEAADVKFDFAQSASINAQPGETAKATVASAVPADAPTPKITGFTVKNGYAYLTVENTVPYLQYNIAAGGKPDSLVNTKAAEAPKGGDAAKAIELKVPLTDGAKFFKVNRNTLETK